MFLLSDYIVKINSQERDYRIRRSKLLCGSSYQAPHCFLSRVVPIYNLTPSLFFSWEMSLEICGKGVGLGQEAKGWYTGALSSLNPSSLIIDEVGRRGTE